MDIVRWLLIPAIIVAAWAVSKTYPQRMRSTVRCLPIVASTLLALLMISGLLREGGLLAEIHRWTGHVLFVVLWLSVPFGMGVVLQQDLRKRPAAAVAQALVLLLGLAIALAASVTAYLGPGNSTPADPTIGEETYNRFLVLHAVVLPGLCAALMVQWWWYFRPMAHATERVD